MDTTNTIVWIVVILAALVVIGLIFWTGRRQRETHRRAQAEEMREQLRRDDIEVRHREAIAAETEAHARAAQAEADAKAAEAQRLKNAADAHLGEVHASREDLEQRRRHVESLDPRAEQPRSKAAVSRPSSPPEPRVE